MLSGCLLHETGVDSWCKKRVCCMTVAEAALKRSVGSSVSVNKALGAEADSSRSVRLLSPLGSAGIKP